MNVRAAVLLSLLPLGVLADAHNPETDWMPGTVGAFMHWWPDANTTNRWNEFDVGTLKRQLVETGVDYFVLTLGQNSNYYNAPNDVYERLAGHEKGTRCSPRDIPAEIIAALRGTGIRFGLYSPCQPSFFDGQAETRMGFTPNPIPKDRDWIATDEGVRNWSKVLKCWSDRYPGEIDLWWFDGAYARLGYNERHGEWMRDALRAANPKIVMAFNGGSADWGQYEAWQRCCDADVTFAEKHPFRTWLKKTDGKVDAQQIFCMEASDFIAGETEEPLRFMPEGRWINKRQYFILTYLGHNWNSDQCRYPDDIWIPWLREYRKRGGSICFDMGRDRSWRDARTGTFVRPHIDQLKRLIRATVAPRPDTVLRETIRVRDPFVLAESGTYYLYQAGGGGVDVRTSSDLERWSERKPAMRLPADVPGTAVWAPEVHKYRGEYWMFVTLTLKGEGLKPLQKMLADGFSGGGLEHRGVWIFKAGSPMGPFVPIDRGPVTPTAWMCLDGTLWVEDGKPWMVFCHEWCQTGNGRMMAAPLAEDLTRFVAEPVELFRAKDAPEALHVTDGPFLYESPEMGLVMIWSNFVRGGYGILQARSESGRIRGPWKHLEPLFSCHVIKDGDKKVWTDGGHGMIFKAFDGTLRLAYHQPNKGPLERMGLKVLKVTPKGLVCE